MSFEPLGHPILSGFWLAQLADITIVAIAARAVIRSIWRTPPCPSCWCSSAFW